MKLWILAGAAALAACAKSDVGVTCTMVRPEPAPDGGVFAVPLRLGELQPGRDYLSFGAIECEERICVRTADAGTSGPPTAVAFGVCSRSCSPGSSCEGKTQCRELLLDQQALAALCANDAQTCAAWSDPQSPWFCAP